jgi:hypothetical protein
MSKFNHENVAHFSFSSPFVISNTGPEPQNGLITGDH